MTSVTLRGLLGRKTRAILTALAIVLGVAMISGTYILTDTIKQAFDNVFTASYRNTSAIITGKELVTGANATPTVPTSVLAEVKALPDVAAAAGAYLFDTVELVDRTGRTLASGGAPSFGFGLDPDETRFNPVTLVSGRWAAGPHEVVIDAGTAAKHGYRVGDPIQAKGNGPIRTYTIVGLGTIHGVSIGGATLALFDVATARAILGKSGFDAVSVAAKPGISQARLAAVIRPLLPAHVQIRTARAEAQHQAARVATGTQLITDILLAFGGIALFVGGFVIFNTISMTVAQRTRELATLRTLGASRRQVRRSVLLESGAIGAAASVVGLFAGLGLAKGLNSLFVALGVDLPQAGTVFAVRTVVVSLLAGTIVTLLAGLFPAIRATRVPPISAVREGAVIEASRRASWRPFVAAALTGLGLLVIAQALFATSGVTSVLGLLGLGTLLLFLGIALVSGYLVRPLVAVVGQPARRLGGTAGRLAAANAVRNKGRTAATAAALMIGLALVAFVATLGAGLRNSVSDALNQQVTADYVVAPGSTGSMSFSPQAAQALAGVPGVRVVSGIRSDRARVFGASTAIAAVDPVTIASVYRFSWAEGSDATLARLGDRAALVESRYATSHHLEVGSRLSLESSSGSTRTYLVTATYDSPQADPLLPNIVISQTAFDRTFPQPEDQYALVKITGAVTVAATARLQRALAAYPDTTISTKTAWVSEQATTVNQTLDLFYVLLALSVIVSLFGMVNTLVLAVFERTRELGMLRAIGMSRRQTRRMIRQESIITALIGAALGLPLGVFLAALATRALGKLGIGFHLPTTQLAAFTLVAVIAGTLAAVLPARRAARLNILSALQYE
jgi:putative ABC transport system permease protein